MKKTINTKGIFDKIENALTLFYMSKNLNKLNDIPFNTFEISLFIEEYLKDTTLNIEELNKKVKEHFEQ